MVLFTLLLLGVASIAALQHRHSSHPPKKVVAVHVIRSVSCAKKVGAALKAAGCHAILRTDVKTELASMCSYEVMNSCDYKSAISGAEGFLKTFRVSVIKRPSPVEVVTAPKTTATTKAFNPKDEVIHNMTGVLDARYKLGLTGKGIKVAIIDTGIYYLHPALGGGFGAGFKVAFGYDLVGDNYNGKSSTIVPDNDPLDNCSPMSHGTHVAGIVAANATSITTAGFVPYTPFTGVAPGVTLGAYRVFGCDGVYTASDIVAAAILRAVQDGADIINLSLGGPGNDEDISAVAAETARKAGRIVVASNGNDGDAGAYVTSVPAASLGALGIASFDNFDDVQFSFLSPSNPGALSSFSSPGLRDDLFIKPDLGGIGGGVYSTISPFAAAFQSAYATYSGTSMASPYVAGSIALLLQKRGKIGFDTARSYLQNTATVTNIPQGFFSFLGDPLLVHSPAFQGAGLVNVYKAATTATLITPSSLSLNDTANRKSVESIRIKNNYRVAVTYRLSHIPAATANTFDSGDDMVLDQDNSLLIYGIYLPGSTSFTSNNIATVKFGNSLTATFNITIRHGQAISIPVQIIAPVPASPDLWPLYGGYIAISNSFDKIVSHVPYAGVAGVWKNRAVWGRNSTSLYNRWGLSGAEGPSFLFGVEPGTVATGLYADSTFTPLTTLKVVNASNYGLVLFPAASASRSANLTITYLCNNVSPLKNLGLERTSFVALTDLSSTANLQYVSRSGFMQRDTYAETQSYLSPHVYGFDGTVFKDGGLNTTASLPAAVYQMKFSAWKNFGNDKELDVITTPPFQLVYNTLLSKQALADCQV